VDGKDVGEQNGITTASLLDIGAVGAGLHLEIEDVRCLSFIEDKENLGEMTLTQVGFDKEDAVDAGLQKGKVLVGHFSAPR
jgi:hypothetical protein